MRLSMKALGLVAAVMALSACGSGAGTGVAPGLASGTGPSAQGVVAHGAGQYVLPAGVHRVCENLHEPGFEYCDALINTNKMDLKSHSYNPTDLQSAYNLPTTGGNGNIVAIVDAFGYPTAEADLALYRSTFNLSVCSTANGCFRKVNQKGKEGHYPKPDSDWDTEQALDVDMVSAACANCDILLVEATTNSSRDLAIAVDTAVKLGATVVSNSYSGNCTGKTAKSCLGKYYTHAGVVILASGGDAGYWGPGAVNNVPAGLPSVIAVGGTSLVQSTGGRGWTETAWSGTGAGCTSFTKPSWQVDTGCAGRTADDVSAVADPSTGVIIYYNGRPETVGGTSVSSPFIGGIYGLAGNGSTINASQVLYTNASDLYDITSGSDGTCSPSYLCTAGVGYDGPTGNGTPNGLGAF